MEVSKLTEDGKVTKEILREGTGPQPKKGDKVKMHYVASVKETGKVYDSSRERDSPYKFVIGETQIEVWSLGALTMHVGELARFTVDAAYAYGEKGYEPDVPPNSTVVIEAELLEIMETFSSAKEAIARADQLNEAAAVEFRAGNFEKALSIYRDEMTVIEDYFGEGTDLVRIRTARNMSLVYAKLGNWKESLIQANQVLDKDRKDGKALIRKVEAEIALERFADARKGIEKGVQMDEYRKIFLDLRQKVEAGEREQAQREAARFAKAFSKE